MQSVMQRVNSFLERRRRARPCAVQLGAPAVEAVLSSRTWCEVLSLKPPHEAGDAGEATRAAADTVGIEGGIPEDLEAASFTLLTWAEELTDRRVLEAFLQVGASVHPERNAHPDAKIAFRWTAAAFNRLCERRGRAAVASGSQPLPSPLREQECDVDADGALHLFSRVVTATYEGLSLRNVEDGGLCTASSDALLQCMYMMHLQHPALQQIRRGDRVVFDSLLFSAVSLNRMMAAITGVARGRFGYGRSERLCSTSVAAIGGMMFTFASRMQQVMNREVASAAHDRPGLLVLMGHLAAPEPMVKCPLCRVNCPVARTIQNVCAGDSVPTCCICTEAKSDVCFPCGHLCVCRGCFQQMPRTMEAPSG